MVICIDEFQQIGEFANSPKFQKILRNHWQEQQDVAYVLYGSMSPVPDFHHQALHPCRRYADVRPLARLITISSGNTKENTLFRWL